MTDKPDIYLSDAFVKDPDALFGVLKSSVDWDESMKARKTASFGVSYNYSGLSYPYMEMHSALVPLCDAIQRVLGFYPNNCLLNYYPDGNAYMGFHSDSSEELAEGTGVVIVSLGTERTIVFRSKNEKTVRYEYRLHNGMLLYMSDQIQQEWMHSIPKEAGAGERISLTFRQINKPDDDQFTS